MGTMITREESVPFRSWEKVFDFLWDRFFDEKYAWNGSSYEFLGNDFDVRLFEGMRTPPVIVSEDVLEIAPDIFLLSNFPRLHPVELSNPQFLVRRSEGFERDPFTDELLLAIKMPQGIAFFWGVLTSRDVQHA